MPTASDLKAQAKRLRHHLAERQIQLTHSQALEAIAAAQGFRDWNTAAAQAGAAATPHPQVVTPELYRALEAQGRERQLDALEGRLRDELLRRLAEIEFYEFYGPPGIIHSATQMYVDLEAKRLGKDLAHRVSRYLFDLPGFFNGRRDDAEALHQQLLALRARRG